MKKIEKRCKERENTGGIKETLNTEFGAYRTTYVEVLGPRRDINTNVTKYKFKKKCQFQIASIEGDKIYSDQKFEFLLEREENIVGKEEKAGYTSICLSFSIMSAKEFFLRVIKSWDCVEKG